MPHRHSAAAHAARQLRAHQRGYMRTKPSPGYSWIAVPDALVPRAKVMVASFETHCDHDRLAGRPSHFARQATIGAANYMSADQQHRALALHRSANKAKHQWPTTQNGLQLSRRGPSQAWTPASPPLSGSPTSLGPLTLHDPWAGCRLPAVAPPVCGDTDVWIHWNAPTSTPSTPTSSIASPPPSGPHTPPDSSQRITDLEQRILMLEKVFLFMDGPVRH